MSKQRDKGTRGESAAVDCALRFGLHAERRALKGNADEGDVWIEHGRAVVEVKTYKGWWTWTQIAGWLSELEAEAARVPHCDVSILVVKRPGVGYSRAEDWFAWVRHDELGHAFNGYESELDDYVMLPFGSLLAALVRGGWAG